MYVVCSRIGLLLVDALNLTTGAGADCEISNTGLSEYFIGGNKNTFISRLQQVVLTMNRVTSQKNPFFVYSNVTIINLSVLRDNVL